MSKLFSPIRIGQMQLAHRIAMAPMTRLRADEAHVPLPMVKDHYSQRATVPGSLVITEATFISARAGGADYVPGIYSEEQVAAWRKVTDAVHQKGSYIYLQLWAVGRVAFPSILEKDGYDLVSSSAVPVSEDTALPRALTEPEIHQYIEDHAKAARNAIDAGFDGVEIHAANGYLIDQFTQDICNQRNDQWGGSVESRARFALAVTKAVVDTVGADRTAIRLSPWSRFQGMRMKDPIPQFTYLAQHLAKLKLSYVHLIESRVSGSTDVQDSDQLKFFLDAYQKASPVLIAGGYTPDKAREALDTAYVDQDAVIAFGRLFTSNSDLVYRIEHGLPLRPYEREYFYAPQQARGYIDYDVSSEWRSAQSTEL